MPSAQAFVAAVEDVDCVVDCVVVSVQTSLTHFKPIKKQPKHSAITTQRNTIKPKPELNQLTLLTRRVARALAAARALHASAAAARDWRWRR